MASRYETKEELETRMVLEKAPLLEDQKIVDAVLYEVKEVVDQEKEKSVKWLDQIGETEFEKRLASRKLEKKLYDRMLAAGQEIKPDFSREDMIKIAIMFSPPVKHWWLRSFVNQFYSGVYIGPNQNRDHEIYVHWVHLSLYWIHFKIWIF